MEAGNRGLLPILPTLRGGEAINDNMERIAA
jgi:hypothetical protein